MLLVFMKLISGAGCLYYLKQEAFLCFIQGMFQPLEGEDFLSQVDDDPPFLVTEGKTYGIP